MIYHGYDKNNLTKNNQFGINQPKEETHIISGKCNDILVNEKILFAKKVLSSEQYHIIGEDWLISDGMTKEKL